MSISTSAHRSGKREEIRFLHKARTVTFVSFESFSITFNKCVSGEGGTERQREKKKTLTKTWQTTSKDRQKNCLRISVQAFQWVVKKSRVRKLMQGREVVVCRQSCNGFEEFWRKKVSWNAVGYGLASLTDSSIHSTVWTYSRGQELFTFCVSLISIRFIFNGISFGRGRKSSQKCRQLFAFDDCS